MVEVLDPENAVVGRLDRNVYLPVGHGFPDQELPLAGSPAIGDLVWYGFATVSSIRESTR